MPLVLDVADTWVIDAVELDIAVDVAKTVLELSTLMSDVEVGAAAHKY